METFNKIFNKFILIVGYLILILVGFGVVILAFTTRKDNRISVLAKEFNTTTHMIHLIINDKYDKWNK